MSYVGIDTRGARALGQVLQDCAVRVEGIRRSVCTALNLADLASQVPVQLALVQDGFTRLAAGVTDKAALAEQYVVDRRATAQSLGAPTGVLGAAMSGVLGFTGPADQRAALVGLSPHGADAAVYGAMARLDPVLLPGVLPSEASEVSLVTSNAAFPAMMRLGAGGLIESPPETPGVTYLPPAGDVAAGNVFGSTRGFAIPAAVEAPLLGSAGLETFSGIPAIFLTGFSQYSDGQSLSRGATPFVGSSAEATIGGVELAQTLPTPRPEFVPRPRVVIAVIGNSYTSGEGGDVDTYERVDVPINGAPFPMIHPAHRSSQAAAMQVIDRLKAENPDVDFEVRFVAVTGATPDRIMYGPTHENPPFDTTRPQVDAAGAQFNIPASQWVSMADIVILGEGGNPHFTQVVDRVMQPGNSYSPQLQRELLGILTDPAFRQQQRQLQDDVLSRMNPQGTLIVTGYPKILPDVMPPTSELYNPFSPAWAPWTGSVLYTEELQMANGFAFELNSQLDSSTTRSGQLWSDRTILFANPWGAFDGQFVFSANPAAHAVDWNPDTGFSRSFHPTPEGFRLLTDFYEPYFRLGVQRAIDRQRPPAPDAPQRRGEVDQPEDGQPGSTRLASSQEPYGELTVPAGITLATRGSSNGEGSYVDASWAAPYLTGDLGNTLPGSFLTGDLANLGITAFGTENLPDFNAAMDGSWPAPYLNGSPGNLGGGNLVTGDLGGLGTGEEAMADLGMADVGSGSDWSAADYSVG